MIRPQKRFEETAKAAKWHWQDTVATNMFQSALEAALGEMVMQYPQCTTPELAAAAFQRTEGAKMFIKMLTGLCESVPEKNLMRQNLNHKA